MRNNVDKIKIVSCFLVLLFVFSSHAGQTASEFQVRYEVQVTAVRESAAQTQVWLKARFYNDSEKEIAIPLWGRAKYNDVFRFKITRPDGQSLTGPIPIRFPDAIPDILIRKRSIPTIENSPFVLIKAKDKVECDIVFQPLETVNVQAWYFPHPGQYTLTALFVNTHSSYVDSQTHKVDKMNDVFIGFAEAPPVTFNITRSAAEGGFEIMGGRRTNRGTLVLSENPGNAQGLTISGKIVDAQGKPLAGTIVEITANKNSGLGSPQSGGDIGDGIIRKATDRQTSDQDGTFNFTDLPSGADSFALYAIHEGNYVQSVTVLSNDKKINRNDVKITMKEGLTMRGKVVDKNGNALAGVRVTGYGMIVNAEQQKLLETGEARVATHEREVYTNEKGQFEINGVGRSDCMFACGGFKPRSDVSPEAGHENDGTWTVILEPAAN